MTKPAERLIAVDGINGAALATTARALVSEQPPRRAAISAWDASGIFGEVQMAESDAGRPCARTLLLLYAADLAFRLRWEIRPALAAGRVVVAAPYVDTAIAFGRATGMDAAWLTDLFKFAITPGRRVAVNAAAARTVAERRGFLEFSIQQIVGAHASAARLELMRRATLNLSALRRQHAKQHGRN
jgi:thymidylate kinase